jgi:hypothetical protein
MGARFRPPCMQAAVLGLDEKIRRLGSSLARIAVDGSMTSIYGVFSESNGAHGALLCRINADLTGHVSNKTEGSNGVLACYAGANENTTCMRCAERPVGTSSHCQRRELGPQQWRGETASGFRLPRLSTLGARVCHALTAAMLRAAAAE